MLVIISFAKQNLSNQILLNLAFLAKKIILPFHHNPNGQKQLEASPHNS